MEMSLINYSLMFPPGWRIFFVWGFHTLKSPTFCPLISIIMHLSCIVMTFSTKFYGNKHSNKQTNSLGREELTD
jgi:hypothetical protein